jgi:hypothetical protein
MYSEKYRCIFVHIPKVAGTSIEAVLLDHADYGPEERLARFILGRNADFSRGPERLSHLTAREYTELGHIRSDVFEACYKFAFVRNPFARLVSEYEYVGYSWKMSFARFVEWSFANVTARHSDMARHIFPQTEYVTDGNGDYIVDFIGRLENIDADFRHVATVLGLAETQLPHINKAGDLGGSSFSEVFKKNSKKILRRFQGRANQRRPYQEYYTPQLQARVADFYADDLQRFGYGFEGFSSAPIVTTRSGESASWTADTYP